VPEGHILHRLSRDLAELVGPEDSAASPQGRLPAEKVDEQRLTGVDAYGKHLLRGTPIVIGAIDGRARDACPRCQPKWAG
jgi:hypothetical protein